MTIITDTREQLPYSTAQRATLIVGDYTSARLLGKFHIERKSLQDLYGTIVQGNSRFKHELFRAAYHQIKIAVYVEGTRADFIAKNFPRGEDRKFSSDGLDKMISTFERKYHLEFHWHTGRKACQAAVYKRLAYEEARLGKAPAASAPPHNPYRPTPAATVTPKSPLKPPRWRTIAGLSGGGAVMPPAKARPTPRKK